MKNKLGISGRVRAWITRIDGTKELVFDSKNAINSSYAADLVDAFDAGMNHALDSLFNDTGAAATPPTNGEDGISIYDNAGGNWYEMLMDTPTESAGVVSVKGTFTGVGITVTNNPAHVLLGHNWNATVFTNPVAQATGWTSQAVLAAETLTVEWTITHAAS